jgi:hypothetical protein
MGAAQRFIQLSLVLRKEREITDVKKGGAACIEGNTKPGFCVQFSVGKGIDRGRPDGVV